MKAKIILIAGIILSTVLSSCVSIITRTETDIHTISERDTIFAYEQKNAPGNQDMGVVYPSSRTFKSERRLYQRDSIVERKYPDFIRLGVFESVGLIGSGAGESSFGTGMFGIFPDLINLKSSYSGDTGKLFSGGIYRIGVGEWRLRWFRDSPNWTYGTSVIEFLIPSAKKENTLSSIFPFYIRKRYFLREEIPYIAFVPSLGIGWYPSQYVNLSGSLDIGSIGGLNLRAYAGLAAGVNSKEAYQDRISNENDKSHTSVFPYFGLGISFLDFVNIVPETYREWKDHEHSSWNIGLIQASLLAAGADSSAVAQNSGTKVFTGFMFKIANASVALPILNNQLYLGTSLANFVVLGFNEWGIGILPIRLGYWQTIIADELSTEPFIEYNYYPSNFLHVGNRVNLRISDFLNLGLVMGFASGETSLGIGSDITNEYGSPINFSRAYVGISVGISDRIFFPDELRYIR